MESTPTPQPMDKDVEQLLKEHQSGGGNSGDGIEYTPAQESFKLEFNMKPKEVKEYLDKYVIGQDIAKEYLSVALCYHYARIARNQERQRNGEDLNGADTTVKENIMVLGGTGVGKSLLLSKLADLVGVPLVKADATKYTAAGYVGDEVDNIIRKLYVNADGNKELAEYGIVHIDEIDKLAAVEMMGRDVGGVDVQRALYTMMEETEIDIFSMADPIASKLAGKAPQEKDTNKAPTINTKNILFVVSGAFPGLEEMVRKRKNIDLFVDGWFQHVTSHDLVRYGFESEFVGRLPVRVPCHNLTQNDLYEILKKSEDSVIKKHIRDFETYGIDVEFSDGALMKFAEQALRENTGARALTKVIADALVKFKFELPSTSINSLFIDEELVINPEKALTDLVTESEMKDFIENFQTKYGINMSFEPDAYARIIDNAIGENVSPKEYCDNILEKYAYALKAYGQKEFTVTEQVVVDPEGSLKKLLNRSEE